MALLRGRGHRVGGAVRYRLHGIGAPNACRLAEGSRRRHRVLLARRAGLGRLERRALRHRVAGRGVRGPGAARLGGGPTRCRRHRSNAVQRDRGRGRRQRGAGCAAARSRPRRQRRLGGRLHEPQLPGPAGRPRRSGRDPVRGDERPAGPDGGRRPRRAVHRRADRRWQPHGMDRPADRGRRGGCARRLPPGPEPLGPRPGKSRVGRSRGGHNRRLPGGAGRLLGRHDVQPAPHHLESGVGPGPAASGLRAMASTRSGT